MTQGQNNQPIRISGEHFPGNCRLNGCEKCREASDTDHLYSDIGSEDSMFGVVMLAKRRAEKIIGGCRTMRERELVETRATIEAAFAIDGHCEVIELVREAVDYVVTLPEGEISSLTAKNVIRSLGMLSMRAKWLRDWEKNALRGFVRALGKMTHVDAMSFIANETTLLTSYRWPSPVVFDEH